MSNSEDGEYFAKRAQAARQMSAAASNVNIAAIHDRMAREYAARARVATMTPEYVQQRV